MTRKLSDRQLNDMVRLREAGWSYKALAKRFSVTAGAIHYQCLRRGAVSPRQYLPTVPKHAHSFVAGDGRTQRRFTQDEDAELIRLEQLGMKYAAIARAIGRPYTSVRIRLMTLAHHEELEP